MKKVTLLIFTALACNLSFAQNTFPTTGNAGIGTGATTPTANLQIHGTTDYIIVIPPPKGGGSTAYSNVGKTSRIALTNSTVGSLVSDGSLLRMSGSDLVLENLEADGTFALNGGGSTMYMKYNRFFLGEPSSTVTGLSKFNIQTSDNGLHIENTTAGTYGLSIRSKALSDLAIQVMGITGTTRNFAVKANGEVFARKYTTTLNSIPDYVFDPSYQLMTFADLRNYLAANRHLPNVPSAKEYTETGVDLGEMNRILLEKTEELTLYILQLEERLKALEEKP